MLTEFAFDKHLQMLITPREVVFVSLCLVSRDFPLSDFCILAFQSYMRFNVQMFGIRYKVSSGIPHAGTASSEQWTVVRRCRRSCIEDPRSTLSSSDGIAGQ